MGFDDLWHQVSWSDGFQIPYGAGASGLDSEEFNSVFTSPVAGTTIFHSRTSYNILKSTCKAALTHPMPTEQRTLSRFYDLALYFFM